ncbi:general transcription factor 3C polypeptide 6 [Anopheles bellator]|uniref:general transcription factor 3C polypeptide 6 n=1 Tax=Anopheles bellator TaxID=139047 RepID=UPI002649D9B2|nr:general transcription factor 3C polypeptide 6 [Anopheles bellator]
MKPTVVVKQEPGPAAAEVKTELEIETDVAEWLDATDATSNEGNDSDIGQLREGSPEDDDEYYEEEMLLSADFETYLTTNDVGAANVQVIGLDTDSPIIQVNDEVYRGTYDFACGTNVFFEKDRQWTPAADSLFETPVKQMYRYMDKSDKILRMKRIFLTEKVNQQPGERLQARQDDSEVVAGEGAGASSSEEEEEIEKFNVSMSYEDALNLHLPEGCSAPRHIPEPQNGRPIVNRVVTQERQQHET